MFTYTEELFDEVAMLEPIHFICLDRAFSGQDDVKANAVLTFKSNQNADGTPKALFKTV
jgi:adenine-specific DNA-methyltransferase